MRYPEVEVQVPVYAEYLLAESDEFVDNRKLVKELRKYAKPYYIDREEYMDTVMYYFTIAEDEFALLLLQGYDLNQ